MKRIFFLPLLFLLITFQSIAAQADGFSIGPLPPSAKPLSQEHKKEYEEIVSSFNKHRITDRGGDSVESHSDALSQTLMQIRVGEISSIPFSDKEQINRFEIDYALVKNSMRLFYQNMKYAEGSANTAILMATNFVEAREAEAVEVSRQYEMLLRELTPEGRNIIEKIA